MKNNGAHDDMECVCLCPKASKMAVYLHHYTSVKLYQTPFLWQAVMNLQTLLMALLHTAFIYLLSFFYFSFCFLSAVFYGRVLLAALCLISTSPAWTNDLSDATSSVKLYLSHAGVRSDEIQYEGSAHTQTHTHTRAHFHIRGWTV